jgi:hypothetical protein
LKTASAILLLLTAAGKLDAGDLANAQFDRHGLRSLLSGGIEMLKNGQLRLNYVQWESGELEDVPYDSVPQSVFDESSRLLEQTWKVGKLSCVYKLEAERLGLSLTYTNTGDRPVTSVEVTALTLIFPETPTGPGWYKALHATSEGVDDVPAVIARYPGGVLAVVSECSDPELQLQLHTTFDSECRVYRVLVRTVARSASDFIHLDRRAIAAGQSVTFEVSLRFGAQDSGLKDLAGDLFSKYAERFPRSLHWKDRRPIGMLVLASSAPQHRSSVNPRGWLSDPQLDMVTTDGKPRFQKRMLAWARQSAAICKGIAAQGAIVWDVEGEEFQPLVFVGDPRMLPKLAPEFDEIADDFFKAFTDAGLKTGVCIRPSRIVPNWKSDPDLPWYHSHMAFDPVEEMAEKIAYAKKRWGCTLFYIDTNITWAFTGAKDRNGNKEVTSWPMRAEMIRRLAGKHPDVLLIPEFQYTGYYSHGSGYRELRGGQATTPERIRAAYSEAFSVINVAEGKIRERRAELVEAVRRGDILMFRGWGNSSESGSVRAIYHDASR